MAKGTNLKFCMPIEGMGNQKMKNRSKAGRGLGHVTYFSDFGTP